MMMISEGEVDVVEICWDCKKRPAVRYRNLAGLNGGLPLPTGLCADCLNAYTNQWDEIVFIDESEKHLYEDD